jgi:CheY-like chemotaxis protein
MENTESHALKNIFTGKKILAAEDVEINREILGKMLEETGISIDFAENGKIALKTIDENPEKYELFLTDIHMPEMDGYETARRIRGLDRGEKIPIIAMTANVFREDIEKCLSAGMNDHIGKPVEIEELIRKLKKYLSR